MIHSKEILDALDDAAKCYSFPMLDNGYYYHGDQRLSIYADQERWAILIEVFAFNNHNYDFEGLRTIGSFYGNCITGEKTVFFRFFSDVSGPTFQTDIRGVPEVRENTNGICLRDKIIHISHSSDYYNEKGINLSSMPKVNAWEMMRGFIPNERSSYFLSKAEISRSIPADLPILLVLNDWYHPDVAMGELPSSTKSFREFAAVITKLDTTRYARSEISNTHWSNWPGGGGL
ncbi:MAG: hypothetical protein EOO39_22110 [Cytophagaceae bacterium]|nr:MAG: hypothetical protein EOO39_22110 [Cytophagaceae bacterium]